MSRMLKTLAARLPKRMQQSLKRFRYGRQIKRRSFRTWEPEYDQLSTFVSPGDWAIDVGANVGHYTVALSNLVGSRGRVVAVEPVPETFELLAANVALLPGKNVTLINAAASDNTGIVGVTIPAFDNGLDNYYLAHLSAAGANESGIDVLCLPIDALSLPQAVRLVKIDAEGHELAVLKGMSGLLRRDSPVLIIENNSSDVPDFLSGFGYAAEKLPGSSNLVFRRAGSHGDGAEGDRTEDGTKTHA